MMRRLTLAALLALVPTLAQAHYPVKAPGDKPAEAFLPADAVAYFRYDGLEAHRKAYDKTAFAEVMKGDLGKFFEYGIDVLKDKVLAREDGPLAQLPLEYREKILKGLPDLFNYFKGNGFVAAVEVIDLKTPRAQLTVVFPNGGEGKSKDAITGTVQLICALAKVEIKEQKALDRNIFTVVGLDPVQIAWWQEGGHLILTIGTEKPEHTLKLIADKDSRPNVTKHPLFKAVSDFNAYETSCRGFLDVEACLKHAKAIGKEADKIVADLGLESIKHMAFYMGYEGKNSRTTILMKTAGERKGLLKLATGQQGISVKDLPPIPADATSVSLMELDLGTLYDTIVLGVETVVGAVDKDSLPEVQKAIKEMNQFLGVDLRKDLLSCLDNRIALFDSPSEGAIMTGTTLCVRIKDAKKFNETIEKMCKSISERTGVQVTVKKRDYNGTELCSVHVNTGRMGFPVVPSYAIHKDWLIMGLYPQPVQGTILRAGGKLPLWKPAPELDKAFAKVASEVAKNPKLKVISFTQDDPRPSIKFILSFGTIAGGLIEMFAPGVFDPSMLPNAHSVCEPLFPNVYLTLDDGETIRYEAYTSLALPLNAGAVTVYGAVLGVTFLGARAGPFGGGFKPVPPMEAVPPIDRDRR